MPELAGIETHTLMTRETFSRKVREIWQLNTFVPTEYMAQFQNWFDSVKYPDTETDDFGWVSPVIQINGLTVFATQMIWSPERYTNLKNEWLNYSVYFDAEQITHPLDKKYGGESLKTVTNIFFTLAKDFHDFPTLLTNEFEDSQLWFQEVGLESHGHQHKYFDLAFVPEACAFDYQHILSGNLKIPLRTGLLIVNPESIETAELKNVLHQWSK